eukprot:CAMPEP_0185388080 /NCGR_PEP_ID=MMETSP1364-20130426/67533_1 /TAXON_ID=38817 /ORGANISM="Gephyrocapsa oceanica, Strain RCC1303" /LENGTH=50 /DNA_ID=CAMNT_0027989989 /DNA_START=34 /DNA_END=183 /DNA_ORIENTATION=+
MKPVMDAHVHAPHACARHAECPAAPPPAERRYSPGEISHCPSSMSRDTVA